jgi:alpha-D-ribose 1-methylphosphonate 5-triphosphate synthase subunit PhnG
MAYFNHDQKNWKGQPAHPIDGYTWFKTTNEERAELIALYDEFAQLDPEKAAKLDKLIDELRHLAIIENEFNSSEGA